MPSINIGSFINSTAAKATSFVKGLPGSVDNLFGAKTASLNPKTSAAALMKKNPLSIREQATETSPLEENPLEFANLQFPLDLGEQSGTGHYVIFYTVENKHSAKMNEKFNKSMNIKTDYEDTRSFIGDEEVGGGRKDKWKMSTLKKSGKAGSGTEAVGETPPNTYINTGDFATHTKVTSAIAMYMPPGIKVSYSVNNGPSELGMGALAGNTINKAMQAEDTKGALKELFKGGGDFAIESARKLALSTGEEMGLGDLEGVLTKFKGKAINNFSETVFEGVKHRQFSYSFQMVARSAKEVENIHKIIKVFKYHMHPEIQSADQTGGLRYFNVPSEFEIHYAYKDQTNNYLNKISRCVLTDFNVDYGGEEFQTFRQFDDAGAAPVEINMGLQFTETTILTKKEMMEGY